MPTYEYACLSCGTHVEVYQRITEEPLRECGVCGGALRKVFHPAGILFKGSGFYATDARSARKKGSGETEPADRATGAGGGKAGEGGKGGSEGSGRSKPEGVASASGGDSSTGGGTKEKSA